ncbi:MAG: hypothetical protein M0R48_07245 [Candidatus Omnitrophica bacterium]|jgi:hypothetical protein|nr:hypothetical protein [Candidatus Omnitrophota bacterium]
MENKEAVRYINDLIQNILPGVAIDIHQQNHFNYSFNVKNNGESCNIIFGRDDMDDFDKALQSDHNSDYYRGLEGSIKFKIYISLGKAGLIPKFPIAKQILDEKRDWHNDVMVHFVREDWFYKVLEVGLKDLKMFLEDIIEKHGPQSEIENELEHIEGLLSYYNKHKSFEERGASDVSLGYLKAAAIAVVLKKEKECQEIKIPRVLQTKNKEIYDIVDELRKDFFLQTKMPDCVYDYAENINLGHGRKEDEFQMVNIPCGPLAKQTCDLKTKIDQDFSKKNIFIDIPYTNYEDCELALRELLKEFGFNPVVAKDRLTCNAVLCKVCKLVKICRFGIVDISSASNSVAYEYGLMHGLGMKVCLLLRTESEKFTDIEGLEHISYSGLTSLKIAVSRWILDNIDDINRSLVEEFISKNESLLKENGDTPLQLLLPKSIIESSREVGLQPVDSKILEILGDIIIAKEDVGMIVETIAEVIKNAEKYKISQEDVFESLDVLESRYFLKILKHLGDPKTYHLSISISGFLKYCELYLRNFGEIVKSIAYEILKNNIMSSKEISQKVNCKPIVAYALFKFLEENDYIMASEHAITQDIVIYDLKGDGKRWFNDVLNS